MIYAFDEFELDTAKVELRGADGVIALEPQVFALLLVLVANHERVLSKDEIIEEVWEGRFISDAAVYSRVKQARQAIGDDGKAQRFVRTVHGKGFRFVGAVTAREPLAAPARPIVVTDAASTPAPKADAAPVRPSIAVLPFRLVGIAGPYAPIADALPHELISQLARLRWLFVIARGSSFRFRSPDADVRAIGQALKVRYCLSGCVEVFGSRLVISAELADTRDGAVVWSERYEAKVEDIHDVRSDIVAQIVAMAELHIPLNEARAARLASPDSLDAWAAYHLGVERMFRFTRADNEAAGKLFERATELEPSFARAHAGLSFTHFQNAFLSYGGAAEEEARVARACAENAVELDPLDPFANYTLGRAFWLKGELEASRSWFDRSTSLSPNYAQGVYARGIVDTLAGRGSKGQEHVDLAMSLSPLDPLLYAMFGTRALSHIVRGEHAEAAEWGYKAACAPNAHELIAVIACAAHALNGEHEAAARWAQNAHSRKPGLTAEHFFRSFPFADTGVRRSIADALGRHGM